MSHDVTGEQTHEIPLEGVDKESVSDYQLLIDEMLKFVSPDQSSFPPLFVKVTIHRSSPYMAISIINTMTTIQLWFFKENKFRRFHDCD